MDCFSKNASKYRETTAESIDFVMISDQRSKQIIVVAWVVRASVNNDCHLQPVDRIPLEAWLRRHYLQYNNPLQIPATYRHVL